MTHSSPSSALAAALVFAVAPLTLTVDRGAPRADVPPRRPAAEIVIQASMQQEQRPARTGMRCPPFSAHRQARICGRFRLS